MCNSVYRIKTWYPWIPLLYDRELNEPVESHTFAHDIELKNIKLCEGRMYKNDDESFELFGCLSLFSWNWIWWVHYIFPEFGKNGLYKLPVRHSWSQENDYWLLFVLNSSDRKRLESTFYENIEKCVTDFHGLSTIIIEEAWINLNTFEWMYPYW